MVTNHHLQIRNHSNRSSFLKYLPWLTTLFQPFDPFFFKPFAKFSLGMWIKLFWILWMTTSSLSKNRPLRSHFKVGNNQKSHGVRCGLYARCTITSVLCHSSHSWRKRWIICGRALSWWCVHHPTSFGRFHLMYLKNFFNTDVYFLTLVPRFSTYSCAHHCYTVCLHLSWLLPVATTRVW